MFKKCGWFYHAVENKEHAKYSLQNLKRYADHIIAIPSIVDIVDLNKI